MKKDIKALHSRSTVLKALKACCAERLRSDPNEFNETDFIKREQP